MRAVFLLSWTLLLLAKAWLAWRLPLFVDEAFYAWEARHLAWAYSDLPGLNAWLARAGISLGEGSNLALRLPFLLLGACIPWLLVRIARRWFGADAGWSAGLLSLLMPLSGLLGLSAMPDVALVFAALLCLDAVSALRDRVHAAALLQLALALAIGALAHYRFAMVLLAGLAGLLLDPRARRLLREPGLWLALAAGALAWWPLLQWNLANAGAGLRFQLLERNPWQFHADALSWLPIQMLLVTPALFVLLLAVAALAWRRRNQGARAGWGLLAGIALVSVGAWFVLGFFADSERVSFHWPLSGWLALLVAAPFALAGWPRWARALVWIGAASGCLLALAFLLAASLPQARSALAGTPLYPGDLGGGQELGEWMRVQVAPGEAIIASNFGSAARIAFALGRADVRVLDDARNRKHGRAAQIRHWGLQQDSPATEPAWFLLDDTAMPMKQRLAAYHRHCALFGALPPPRLLSVDHGSRRFLLFRFDPRAARPGCIAPALSYIDAPQARASVPKRFEVAGWAFKDGAGISRVEVLLDGRPLAVADYGAPLPGIAGYWKISTDPAHPRVGFRARVDASAFAPGRHWLGLRLHGRDGSVEEQSQQPLELAP